MLLEGVRHGSRLCNRANAGALPAMGVGGDSVLALLEDRRHKLRCFPLVQCKPVRCALS